MYVDDDPIDDPTDDDAWDQYLSTGVDPTGGRLGMDDNNNHNNNNEGCLELVVIFVFLAIIIELLL